MSSAQKIRALEAEVRNLTDQNVILRDEVRNLTADQVRLRARNAEYQRAFRARRRNLTPPVRTSVKERVDHDLYGRTDAFEHAAATAKPAPCPSVSFGRLKGTPLAQLDLAQLRWFADRAKQRQELPWLAQLEAELIRRQPKAIRPDVQERPESSLTDAQAIALARYEQEQLEKARRGEAFVSPRFVEMVERERAAA
jgi:hypothetical protein